MRFQIRHELPGRIRIHVLQRRMSCAQADTLLYYLRGMEQVTDAKVYERTCDASVCYTGERNAFLAQLARFSYETAVVPKGYLENSGRELNAEYEERLIGKAVWRCVKKMLLPAPLRAAITSLQSVRYILKGARLLWQRKIEVPVLDAAAIGASLLRRDFDTAGSVMFLLGIGELLEEWTHKKSVDDLARTMSLNVGRVWRICGGQEVLTPADDIAAGDMVVVHMGSVIPFDGEVCGGEATVNQASMTGEAAPVRKAAGSSVYAGTVLEEGELTVCVKETCGASRYEKITAMIEESEKLKSALESRAEHLADRLVPYSLGATALTWLLTRNAAKALSILMVDFSCALKLAMPVSVLSAIREAGTHDITVKGGKYLEAVAEADTIVFDKTGTLTMAQPTVAKVVSFCGKEPDELLRIAACLEEHFPHSMAKAVVNAAQKKHLEHEEMHTKVEYIVAHGISTMIEGKRAVIGSYHFVFEDEGCVVPEDRTEEFEALPEEYSHLYLAIENRLAAVICIEDPLRPEAEEVMKALRRAGIGKLVMMTGDSERTARAVAARVGVDEYYSEVLPEDKAGFVERERAAGRKVIMIGDGINDSPALSAADAGIAVSDGAELAREIADITIRGDSLYRLVTLKRLADALMKRIHGNYRFIAGFNSGLIGLGVAGVLQPTASALLHNTSTLAVGLRSMRKLLEE